MMGKRIVIALGGNALGENLPQQMIAVKQTARAIVDLIQEGHQVVIAHGNGPQVGMIQKAMAELTRSDPEKYIPCPLSVCVAMSQGYIGYDLQNALREEMLNRGVNKGVATVLTQVEVDPADPAFQHPTKPIGAFMTKEEADKMVEERGYDVIEDSGRGYRRVVASPKPVSIVEIDSIRDMVAAGLVVVACGGGGIPVFKAEGNRLTGAAAVIDKDFASCTLAQQLDADYLIILTAVEKVAIHFGKPGETWLSTLTPAEARQYMAEGHFAPGSMLPKVEAAVEFADAAMEAVCYYAYWASTELARERGVYSSYPGSLWSQGILPLDTLDLLAQARGHADYVQVDRSMQLDWEALRRKIAQDGMRNSNCVAIAPTATISNIVGVDASIEPSFGNLSVKSNLSGEFTVINQYLVRDLKKLGLWDDVMVMDLKHFDGSLRPIERVPHDLKQLYATAFEVEPHWLVEAASRRQKWIDQAQSLNIYMAGASGKKLHDTYLLAWQRGLKTTYYLRTISATHVEKSTVQSRVLNAVSSGAPAASAAPAAKPAVSALEAAAAAARAQAPATDIKFCAIDDPGCEACQ